jgi:hypothetical protein
MMFVPRSLEDLKRIVEQRLEETARLEFKRQLPEPGKNDDLAKDLAAMANTEGGVIIYGIEQDEMGRAKDLRPFEVAGTGERVTLVAQNSLDEPLTLGSVQSIASEDGETLGFLVVEVPRSERAPHLHQGSAWGRTPKGNAPLTRRRIGELFARSPGFAEEFGLVAGLPGRVIVKRITERYQETDAFGQVQTRQRQYLVFENDGNADVFNVEWEWVTTGLEGGAVPSVLEDPFPLERMQPGVQVPVLAICSRATAANVRVLTHWRDVDGREQQQTWPVTF